MSKRQVVPTTIVALVLVVVLAGCGGEGGTGAGGPPGAGAPGTPLAVGSVTATPAAGESLKDMALAVIGVDLLDVKDHVRSSSSSSPR